MKKSLISVFIITLLVITAIQIAFVSDAADDETATVDGYIKINGTFSENKDIIITFYDSADDLQPIQKRGINENGYFSLNVPGGIKSADCMISFSLNGHSVENLPKTITDDSIEYKGEIFYRMSNEFAGGTIEAGHVYSLCERDLHSISIISTYGVVTGKVIADTVTPVGLNDVNVLVMDGDKIITSTITSNGGKFTIGMCPTGTYTIKFTTNGYGDVSETIIIEQGKTVNVPDVVMIKTADINGLSFVQIAMIVGFAIAMLALLLSIIGFITLRSGKRVIVYKKN